MLFGLILIPFLTAAATLLIHQFLKDHAGWFVLPVPIVLLIGYLGQLPAVLGGEVVSTRLPWVPSLGIFLSFQLDGLSLVFALLITFVGIVVVFYSIFYLSKTERLCNFYVFLLLFMGAMLGVVTSANVIVTYLFWELTSVSSFLLIGFWFHKDASCYGAQKAMLITVAGGFCMLVSFILMGTVAGTFEFSGLLEQGDLIRQSPLYPAIAILLMLGAFTKSAQVPFHIWLPSAMEAPTPVSCYLHSATMVKAGVYLIARFSPLLSGALLWHAPITFIGLASLCFGSFMALRNDDLKAIWAYHSVSQLGLIFSLLGMGSPSAIAAGLFHTATHSAFKGSLFLMTGMVDHQTGTRSVDRLGGLRRAMPFTAVVCFVGCCSMAGLPPFAGFLSKELFLEHAWEMLHEGPYGSFNALIPLMAVVGSLCTLLCSLSTFARVFFGKEVTKNTPKPPKEASWGMLAPSLLLCSMNLLLPMLINRLLPQFHVSYWHGITPAFCMTLTIVCIGALILSRFHQFHIFINRGGLPFGANRAYNASLPLLISSTGRVTRCYMTGNLSHYLSYILAAFLLLSAWPILRYQLLDSVSTDDLALIEPIEVVLAVVCSIAALLAATQRKRTHVIMSMGVCGYLISAFFVMFSAPDLALTQFLVESVTLILYVLVLPLFPRKLFAENVRKSRRTLQIGISACVGILVAALSLLSHSNRFFETISDFYMQYSIPKGGGRNIVNVMLVDFRGIDTMGEATVLALAALGVFVLIHLFTDSEGKTRSYPITYGLEYKTPPITTNNVILLTMARPIMLIILFISVYLLLAGHNNPGGGFIAGLMSASGALLLYVTYGKRFMMRIPSPVSLEQLLPLGLSLISGCGLLSCLLGDAFLTQYVAVLPLPLFGMLEVVTATIFDTGVYLVVIGSVMSIILNIGKIQE